MRCETRSAAALLTLALLTPSMAAAQTPAQSGTPTTSGDSGLWFVPSADVLPVRRWSVAAYRVNFDYDEGFTDVTRWPIGGAIGVWHRLEVFGTFEIASQIDRDLPPQSHPLPGARAVVNEHPFVRQGSSATGRGDLRVGAKFNLWRQPARSAALAIRGIVKIPTADQQDAGGTGQADVAGDAIISGRLLDRVSVAAFTGYMFRGDPEVFDLMNGIRWGIGAALDWDMVQVTAEVHGERFLGDAVRFTGVQIQMEPTFPIVSEQRSPVNVALGLTWMSPRGVFAGAGLQWNPRLRARSEFSVDEESRDSLGLLLRAGYTPRDRSSRARDAANRPPSVRALCQPCTVEVGKGATLTAEAVDPNGDPLRYRWSAAAGTLASPSARDTAWTAPMQEGAVQFTVEVEDGRGARATDAITIQVVRPAVATFSPAR